MVPKAFTTERQPLGPVAEVSEMIESLMVKKPSVKRPIWLLALPWKVQFSTSRSWSPLAWIKVVLVFEEKEEL